MSISISEQIEMLKRKMTEISFEIEEIKLRNGVVDKSVRIDGDDGELIRKLKIDYNTKNILLKKLKDKLSTSEEV